MKKEIMEMNASYAEKDARRRVQMAEEKAELVSELSCLSYAMIQINTKLTLVFCIGKFTTSVR